MLLEMDWSFVQPQVDDPWKLGEFVDKRCRTVKLKLPFGGTGKAGAACVSINPGIPATDVKIEYARQEAFAIVEQQGIYRQVATAKLNSGEIAIFMHIPHYRAFNTRQDYDGRPSITRTVEIQIKLEAKGELSIPPGITYKIDQEVFSESYTIGVRQKSRDPDPIREQLGILRVGAYDVHVSGSDD